MAVEARLAALGPMFQASYERFLPPMLRTSLEHLQVKLATFKVTEAHHDAAVHDLKFAEHINRKHIVIDLYAMGGSGVDNYGAIHNTTTRLRNYAYQYISAGQRNLREKEELVEHLARSLDKQEKSIQEIRDGWIEWEKTKFADEDPLRLAAQIYRRLEVFERVISLVDNVIRKPFRNLGAFSTLFPHLERLSKMSDDGVCNALHLGIRILMLRTHRCTPAKVPAPHDRTCATGAWEDHYYNQSHACENGVKCDGGLHKAEDRLSDIMLDACIRVYRARETMPKDSPVALEVSGLLDQVQKVIDVRLYQPACEAHHAIYHITRFRDFLKDARRIDRFNSLNLMHNHFPPEIVNMIHAEVEENHEETPVNQGSCNKSLHMHNTPASAAELLAIYDRPAQAWPRPNTMTPECDHPLVETRLPSGSLMLEEDDSCKARTCLNNNTRIVWQHARNRDRCDHGHKYCPNRDFLHLHKLSKSSVYYWAESKWSLCKYDIEECPGHFEKGEDWMDVDSLKYNQPLNQPQLWAGDKASKYRNVPWEMRPSIRDLQQMFNERRRRGGVSLTRDGRYVQVHGALRAD